jgi:putative inorganic carbon (hco3(-)) transporter
MKKFLPDTNSSVINPMVPVLDKTIRFSLLTFVIFSVFSISVTQISFAIGAIASLIKTHLTKSWKELRGTYVGIAIFCFCLACVFSIITSVDFGNSLKLLKKLLQFIILFWVANAVQDEKQRDLLFKLVIVAGVVSALNALLPFIHPFFLSIDNLYGSTRIIGTMSVPSTFSGIIMIVGLSALGRLLFTKPREYWVMGSVGVITLCLLITMTRQAWFGFFIGTLFLILFSKNKYFWLIPIFLVGILMLSGDIVIDRIYSLTNLKDSSLTTRIFLWKGGVEMFKDYPITGCGYKCVDLIYSQYSDPSGWVAHYKGLHNNIFQLLIDTGIIGLGFWVCIWVAYFYEAFKSFQNLTTETPQNNTAGILMGASAAVLAFLAGGLFESNFYDSEVTMLVYFLMGLSLAQVKNIPQSNSH